MTPPGRPSWVSSRRSTHLENHSYTRLENHDANVALSHPPLRQSDLTSRPLPPVPRIEEVEDMTTNNSNAFPQLEGPMNQSGRASTPNSQVNGNGVNYANNYIPPLPVGHQQDLAFLYQQIQELSGILQNNRERVNDVTRSAEEVARRGQMTNGHNSEDPTADQPRIRDLERDLANAHKIIDLYKNEQKENTALVGQYEQGMWHATEQIRDYTNKNEDRFIAQKKHYNDLLQQEKDDHFQTRLEKDHWQQQTLRLCEMIRKAYRMRVEEWCDEYRTVVGLQSEVRCYRRILGMPREKPEEETGWPYLKDAPFDDEDTGSAR